MPIKNFLLKYLFRNSPGLLKVAEDRAAFQSELEATRANLHKLSQKLKTGDLDIEALNIDIGALKANIAALNSVQQEINQSLIEKDAQIESLAREQRALTASLVKANATIEFLSRQGRQRKLAANSIESSEVLTGVADSGANNAYQQNIKVLEGSRDILGVRVAELISQLKKAGNRDFIAEATSQRAQPPAPAVLTKSRRRAKFAVFSNPRSGSTWLETMLGLLPDVFVDYELKWGVTYVPGDLHAVIGEDTQSISELLENMGTGAPVTGSKFVFDILGLTPIDFKKLQRKIGSDVRVVHLSRNYRDVFLSIRRGYYHAPVRTEGMTERLRTALDGADVRHASNGTASQVHPLTCFNELSTLLDNDLYIRSLQAAGFPYFQVSYDDVPEKLGEIASFVGCSATPGTIADLLQRPAVVKLPPVDSSAIVSNLAELEPLFESFELLRQRVLAA